MADTIREGAPQTEGILMSTMARKIPAHVSPATGHPSSATGTVYSPGAVLGTGDNVDIYFPTAEV